MIRLDLLFRPLSPVGLSLGAAFLAVLLLLPFWGGSYVMTVATTVFYLALIGQSWNLMLGFAGLLSIGHALFVGIGAYTSAYLFAAIGLPRSSASCRPSPSRSWPGC